MTDFNFTVRATDNAGAFSDRTFSLTVNDTTTSSIFDRFVVLGTQGLARSADGVTWSGVDTSIPSNNMNSIAYGNNTWVIYSSQGLYMRTASASSMSWAAGGVPSFVNTGNGGKSPQQLGSIVYRKGVWSALISTFISNGYGIDEYTSTDLKTFTWARVVASFGNTSAFYPAVAHDYDPISDTWVTYANTGVYRRVGDGPWTNVANLANGAPTYNAGTVFFKNGLWLVASNYNATFLTSTDGTNFVQRAVDTATTTYRSFSYQNGRLLGSPLSGSTGTALNASESLNGGRTFQARSAASVQYPQTYVVGTNAPYRQVIATYAGQTVVVPGTADRIWRSNNDMQSFSSIGLTGLGTPLAVLARD